MTQVVNFRPFKVPQIIETQFFSSSTKANEEFAIEDLKRSGLTMEDIHAYQHPMLPLKDGAQAGYIIPYFGLDGQALVDANMNLVMSRTRLKYPEFSKTQRYSQPSAEQLAKYNLPSYVPYIHPSTLKLEGDTLVCCEGEKKCASVIKYVGLPSFGIGGCEMWRDPSGRGGIHPWIRELIRQRNFKTILIVPDGDLFRYDICRAYGTFAHALRNEGYDVKICNPDGKIDDLIVSWGSSATSRFRDLPTVGLEELVQSPASLAKRFNLSFKQDEKGRVSVYQHTANITKLMEEYSAFPKIWRNLDTNRVMVGDEEAEPDKTDMDIANYIQHHLGLDKVTKRVVHECIQSIARGNSRSPFLEYVQAQTWDGTERLDTWMQRLWGVEDTPYAREVSAKWLIGAVARMDHPGTKLDWMMIVIGPQGTGKTTMPSVLFKGLNRTLYGDHDHKDLHMLLHSGLCVGFDELDSFGKKESSNLKAMVTTHEDAFRPPYGASVEIFPRRFTLYGCGNRYEFLQHDPSGYRRYAILEVAKLLDFSGLEAERDQLWAEAWHRYNIGGVKYWEVEGASAHAERYVIESPQLQRIAEIIEQWKKERPTNMIIANKLYITLGDIQMKMGIDVAKGNSSQNREMGAVMRSLMGDPTGAIRGPKAIKQRYYVVEL